MSTERWERLRAEHEQARTDWAAAQARYLIARRAQSERAAERARDRMAAALAKDVRLAAELDALCVELCRG